MRINKSISITSGKGGVGKSTLLSNVAQEFSRLGKRVLLFDGDIGMGNLHILFGVKSTTHILNVIKGEATIDEAIVRVMPGVDLIPGGSGLIEANSLTAYEHRNLLDTMDYLGQRYDYMLVDTAPGLADHVLYLNAAVDETAVVITPDPSSFADAYALIKVLNSVHKVKRFSIISNLTRDASEGLMIYRRFSEVVDRFLNVSLNYIGSVPYDTSLRKSGLHRRLMMNEKMGSPVTNQIRKIAHELLDESMVQPQSKGLQLLWSQVVGLA